MNGHRSHHHGGPSGGSSSSSKAWRTGQLRREAAALWRRALSCRSAADLACKVPLVVGALLLLLLVTSVLQYAAGPALHHALPLAHERGARAPAAARGSSQSGAADAAGGGVVVAGGRHHHHLREGVAPDALPGGADAELLCVDRLAVCDPGQCSRVSAKYQDCKATCNGCEHLRAAIQADTGLQLRVVQQLSGCRDLHPSCQAWQAAGKCRREPKAMLELCQAACGFCLPQAASPLATAAGGGAGQAGAGQAGATAGGASSSSQQPDGLLDECQDDINVCPYLAVIGLCSSSSLWVETQCRRSCGQCTVAGSGQAGGGSSSSSSAEQQAPTAAAMFALDSAGINRPAAIPAKPVGVGRPSRYSLYGRDSPGGPMVARRLQEWDVPGCHDNVDRCAAWARGGECDKNRDYMAIACKASCGACATHQLVAPFAERQLASGWAMPAVGFGTAGLGPGTQAAVEFAAAAGYRLFDTAESKDWYDEAAVGAGLTASKVPRAQLFLTSKVHPRDLGRAQTLAAVERALGHLATSYLDLVLLHYPACFPGANCIPTPTHSWQESWRALEGLVASGRVRSIGVSNFGLAELQELVTLARVPPSVVQARSDPFAAGRHITSFCLSHNITFVGYSSLGTQWINSPASINPVFNSSVIQAVAARHPGRSAAQVVLRWALQKGQAVIPRSASPAHIPENRLLFDFALSEAEVQAIDGLDGTWKTGGLPLPVA